MSLSLTAEDKEWIESGFGRLERLVVDFKESIEREMHQGFARLDNMSTRLDNHANQLRAGSQRLVGVRDWQERIDEALKVKDQQIADLNDRVRRLEQK
jgi:hypothetical protein